RRQTPCRQPQKAVPLYYRTFIAPVTHDCCRRRAARLRCTSRLSPIQHLLIPPSLGALRVDDFARRRQRLGRLVREAGVDLLAISHPVNVSYLTNFGGDSSWLLVGPKRVVLVSDGRYTLQIQGECPGLETHIRRTEQTIVQAVAEVLVKLGARNVGVE